MLSPTQSTPIASYQQPVPTNNITFCWSGQRIYATTSEGYTRVLDYPSFEPAFVYDYKAPEDAEMKLHGHTSACTTVEVHPMNRYVATGGADSLISLFDTEEWNCQRTITKMVGPIKSMSRQPLPCHSGSCLSVPGFSFDGNYLVSSDEGKLAPGSFRGRTILTHARFRAGVLICRDRRPPVYLQDSITLLTSRLGSQPIRPCVLRAGNTSHYQRRSKIGT